MKKYRIVHDWADYTELTYEEIDADTRIDKYESLSNAEAIEKRLHTITEISSYKMSAKQNADFVNLINEYRGALIDFVPVQSLDYDCTLAIICQDRENEYTIEYLEIENFREFDKPIQEVENKYEEEEPLTRHTLGLDNPYYCPACLR